MKQLKDNNIKYLRVNNEGKPRGTTDRYITYPEVVNLNQTSLIEKDKLYLNYFHIRATLITELAVFLEDDTLDSNLPNLSIIIGIYLATDRPNLLINSNTINLQPTERQGLKTITITAELPTGNYCTAFVCNDDCNIKSLTPINGSGLLNSYGTNLDLSAIETGIKAVYPYSELPTNINGAGLIYEFCEASPLIFIRR